jgi:hypothetical protein
VAAPKTHCKPSAPRILKMMASATIQWWGEELSVSVLIGCAGARTGDTVESILDRAQPGLGGDQVALPGRAIAVGAANSRPGN